MKTKFFICFDRCPVGQDVVAWAAAVVLEKHNIDVSGWHAEADHSAWVVVFTK